MPFVAVVLPCLFIPGIFTVVRLIDTALEAQQYLSGIARIRSYYRTLSPEAARYFSAQSGRWPEASNAPALSMGRSIAFLGTTATMVAFLNNVIAGVAVALGVRTLTGKGILMPTIVAGALTFAIACAAFLLFQRWRFAHVRLPSHDIGQG